jgi:MraZ protein
VFVGEYERSVDGNGRLALPSTFRDDLGERCYVTRDPQGFLAVRSEAEFNAAAAEVIERVRLRELPRSATRSYAVQSSLLAIDKQGRITLDDESRRHAGIASGGTVMIAGDLTNLQIWRKSRFLVIRDEDGDEQPARSWNDEETA